MSSGSSVVENRLLINVRLPLCSLEQDSVTNVVHERREQEAAASESARRPYDGGVVKDIVIDGTLDLQSPTTAKKPVYKHVLRISRLKKKQRSTEAENSGLQVNVCDELIHHTTGDGRGQENELHETNSTPSIKSTCAKQLMKPAFISEASLPPLQPSHNVLETAVKSGNLFSYKYAKQRALRQNFSTDEGPTALHSYEHYKTHIPHIPTLKSSNGSADAKELKATESVNQEPVCSEPVNQKPAKVTNLKPAERRSRSTAKINVLSPATDSLPTVLSVAKQHHVPSHVTSHVQSHVPPVAVFSVYRVITPTQRRRSSPTEAQPPLRPALSFSTKLRTVKRPPPSEAATKSRSSSSSSRSATESTAAQVPVGVNNGITQFRVKIPIVYKERQTVLPAVGSRLFTSRHQHDCPLVKYRFQRSPAASTLNTAATAASTLNTAAPAASTLNTAAPAGTEPLGRDSSGSPHRRETGQDRKKLGICELYVPD